jgi:hypothetical protein
LRFDGGMMFLCSADGGGFFAPAGSPQGVARSCGQAWPPAIGGADAQRA